MVSYEIPHIYEGHTSCPPYFDLVPAVCCLLGWCNSLPSMACGPEELKRRAQNVLRMESSLLDASSPLKSPMKSTASSPNALRRLSTYEHSQENPPSIGTTYPKNDLSPAYNKTDKSLMSKPPIVPREGSASPRSSMSRFHSPLPNRTTAATHEHKNAKRLLMIFMFMFVLGFTFLNFFLSTLTAVDLPSYTAMVLVLTLPLIPQHISWVS